MSAAVIDRVIEGDRARGSPLKPPPAVPPPPPRQQYFISPALYETPELFVPSSPISLSPSPSPYVVNHKGRRTPPAPPLLAGKLGKQSEVSVGGDEDEREIVLDGENSKLEKRGAVVEAADADEPEYFEDPADARSEDSSCSRFGNQMTPGKGQSEFYDATEDFLAESASSVRDHEMELQFLHLNLQEETEKRKSLEAELNFMRNQWQCIIKSLAQSGLSLSLSFRTAELPCDVYTEDIFHEAFIVGLVNADIDKALIRDEVEGIAEEVVNTKNHEISRLKDRLQYYETVNREMSTRNQEVLEAARQRRLRRRTRQKWIWGSVGLAVTIGASCLAYSLLRCSPEISSLHDNESTESGHHPRS